MKEKVYDVVGYRIYATCDKCGSQLRRLTGLDDGPPFTYRCQHCMTYSEAEVVYPLLIFHDGKEIPPVTHGGHNERSSHSVTDAKLEP